MSELTKKVSRHWKHSLWIVVLMALAALMVMNIRNDTSMVEQLILTVAFSLVSAGSFVAIELHAAKKGGLAMMKMFLVHSTLRMIAAAAAIIIYANAKGWLQTEDRKPLLAFVILFAVFYLTLLVFDTVKVMKWQGAIQNRE